MNPFPNLSRIKLTKARALAIQAEHVAHYSPGRPWLAEAVAAATSAEKLPDDVEIDVVVVNRHIPRGGAIEWMITQREGK
jgi:hypothetical protein